MEVEIASRGYELRSRADRYKLHRRLRLRDHYQQGGRIMSGESTPPIACSLRPSELNARQERIASLARRSLLHQRQDGRTLTVRYARSASRELRELVALERECCAFLQFRLHEDSDAIELQITAPHEAEASAALLFSAFVATPSGNRGCNSACTCTGQD
ncbi:hypothetical protein [Variovorax sp. V116]|uniref:hypothetical protein n=1 Tax=Variovorax sp. V116 TaxID=3065953 RepID=UPI0034E8EDD3